MYVHMQKTVFVVCWISSLPIPSLNLLIKAEPSVDKTAVTHCNILSHSPEDYNLKISTLFLAVSFFFCLLFQLDNYWSHWNTWKCRQRVEALNVFDILTS